MLLKQGMLPGDNEKPVQENFGSWIEIGVAGFVLFLQ